ncbi:MAG: glycosyltransferase family 9 protein [Planctomycetes bacterium]|nr:glycosyltransferase family 9 protein [Planctomycetota bacterium]
MKLTDLHLDCRHFRGDRPCRPHKQHGVECPGCPHYDPVRTRALIVKLAAAGDVLRSTSILPALHAAHPGLHVTWVTAAGAVPLLEGNRLIDRVIAFRGALPVELAAETFDLVINLDAAPDSCALATAARGAARKGFGLDGRGRPTPLHAEAESWYLMGLSDARKKENQQSYPDIMLGILGLRGPAAPPQLELSASELAAGRAFYARAELRGRRVVGLNTGAGGRWEHKKWTFEGYAELIRRLLAEGHGVVLLGGPEEAERNRALRELSPPGVVDAGTDNSLRHFAAIVDGLDAMVTGDTLAMHIAMARAVELVVLFGPTSLPEIDVFGRGEKLVADLPCLCCYLSTCEVKPHCMESIAVDTVHGAVKRALERRAQARAPSARSGRG